MESSAGPISAEQIARVYRAALNASTRWQEVADALNALIAPLIQAARADAAAEMRERCAVVADGEFVSYRDAANKIRALPLQAAEE